MLLPCMVSIHNEAIVVYVDIRGSVDIQNRGLGLLLLIIIRGDTSTHKIGMNEDCAWFVTFSLGMSYASARD